MLCCSGSFRSFPRLWAALSPCGYVLAHGAATGHSRVPKVALSLVGQTGNRVLLLAVVGGPWAAMFPANNGQ